LTAARVLTPAFEPPFWLAHRQLQAILPSVGPRRASVLRRAAPLLGASREWILDCGDGVRLAGYYAAQPAGAGDLVLLLHGWEGSAESLYVLSAGQYLWERGFAVFRLNLRDHGATHHLNSELFHSCRILEVVGAVRAVQQRAAARSLAIVGYSLGGNFALRVAVRAPAAGIALRQVIAVCPVLDPVRTLANLEHGPWIYRRYFVLKWRNSLRLKVRAWPGRYDAAVLLAHRSLTAMTENLVLRYTEFPDLRSYLHGYAITGAVLGSLAVPARVIASHDDPIISSADLARLAPSPQLEIETTRRGGHCGFLDHLYTESWADRQVYAMLANDDNRG
jgi:uncharacterized protein